jgi:hypothetical protein
MRTMLQTQALKQKVGAGSCTSEKCLIDLGNALECEKMVVGMATFAFGKYSITVKMLDVVKQNYERAEELSIKAKEDFPDAAAKLALMLTGSRYSAVTGQGLADGRYTDNSDGTVTDSVTNLVWMKCSQGQSNDGFCGGEAKKFQYCTNRFFNINACDNGSILTSGPAFDSCNSLNNNPAGGFAGRTTWRVPTKDELKSLVYCSNGPTTPLTDFKKCAKGSEEPAINKTIFPNTVSDNYWSATTYAVSTTSAWLVSFYYGYAGSNGKPGNGYARCVSPGP